MQSPSRSTLAILPLHGPFLCSKYTPPFWWWWDLMATDQFEQVHLTNKKWHVLRSVLFLFHKVWEFRYLYWVPFYCEQIKSQQKRSTMKKTKKKKHTKKLNRSNAYHAFGRVWLQILIVRDKSSSIAVLNIFLFDCFKSDLSFEEMDEEHVTDDTTITR